MQIESKVIKVKKHKWPEISPIEFIEAEIKKNGEPLRWAVVKTDKDYWTINAVLTVG